MENAKMNSLIAPASVGKGSMVALKETTGFNPGTTSLTEGFTFMLA